MSSDGSSSMVMNTALCGCRQFLSLSSVPSLNATLKLNMRDRKEATRGFASASRGSAMHVSLRYPVDGVEYASTG